MRLIDFEKARKEVLTVLAGKVNTVIAIKVVEALRKATIEAEPVRHGRWVFVEQRFYHGGFVNLFRCSECSGATDREHNYCPNCGAKMEA